MRKTRVAQNTGYRNTSIRILICVCRRTKRLQPIRLARQMPMPDNPRTQEVLSEAHGRSTEQHEPPENLQKGKLWRTTEKMHSVHGPTTLRSFNARSRSHTVSLSFIVQGGRPFVTIYITLILCAFGQRYPSIFNLPNITT